MVVAAVLLAGLLGQAPQASESADAEGLFQKHSARVLQVRVTSEASGAKSVIGTGFFVSADGLVITNYHVVAELVAHPDRFRCKVVTRSGVEQEAEVLDLDVVHDLALLRTRIKSHAFFVLTEFELAQGAHVFSLGNPHDVGLSIVEGTYNGLLSETLYDRIHFTGSLNPGMSGGPAIDRAGRVVGVNVASMGNQLSFLVPVKFARALAERVHAEGAQDANQLKERVRVELLEAQAKLSQELLAAPPAHKQLGNWTVPGRWVTGLKEWGSQISDDDDPWAITTYSATSDDAIYLDSSRYAGGVWVKFRHVQGKQISPARLYYRWGNYFARSDIGEYSFEASRDNATNWNCETAFVRGKDNSIMRVAYCVRAFKPFEGLYDVLLRTLSFNQTDAVLLGEMGVGGVTAENGRALAKRFLEGISWSP